MNAQLKPVPAFARESGADVMGEIGHLLEEHCREVTHHADIPVGCDFDKYLLMERAGVLRIYTVRSAGELVGYWIGTIATSLHYKSSLQARMDTLFLSAEHRKGRTGIQFLKWVETQIKAEGVQIVYQHGKFVKDTRSLWDYLGYEPVYYVYSKRLDA